MSDNDWIDWAGGECPVDRNACVVVKTRGGQILREATAKFRQWHHYHPLHWQCCDIIAYRVVQS